MSSWEEPSDIFDDEARSWGVPLQVSYTNSSPWADEGIEPIDDITQASSPEQLLISANDPFAMAIGLFAHPFYLWDIIFDSEMSSFFDTRIVDYLLLQWLFD
uniref:Uncharacterized protein n=1 Tax=Strombidium inclinatum TaxID=197538 RepID=A0A7S3IR41_9SPIT|mmetsp:Transcript_35014/g.53751  ORF Transcript_35014/g.53751 Transcript_35014/m.53751 type:complete len:102 (+) Transcript_35014:241-546(+)